MDPKRFQTPLRPADIDCTCDFCSVYGVGDASASELAGQVDEAFGFDCREKDRSARERSVLVWNTSRRTKQGHPARAPFEDRPWALRPSHSAPAFEDAD